MSITLKWVNPNTTFDEVQIFRSEVKPVVDEVPTNKIATITNGATEYTDNTAALNKYYWYWIAVKVGSEIVYGFPYVAINMPYTGPGPTELLRGDWTRGYFGSVPSTDFGTNAEIIAWLGFGTPWNIVHNWHKFILDGKILYFPERYVGSGSAITWNSLYSNGAVYGMDNNGPASGHGLTPVNQKKVFTKGEHSFMVRLPRGQVTPDWTYGGVQRVYESEWYMTMASLFNIKSPPPALDLGELAGTLFTTGFSPLAEFNNVGCIYVSNSPTVVAPSGSSNTRTTAMNWRPVFELII